MKSVFINLTNHPSAKWSQAQRTAAENYGAIVDLPFPMVDANWTTKQVADKASEIVAKIIPYHPQAVLCQGEMTLTYAITHQLQAQNILVLAACSERLTQEETLPDGTSRRVSLFQFTQFRAYPK